MYSVNDIILYGNEGVCRIGDIVPRKFGETEEDYYVLHPVNNESLTLYVSVAKGNLEAKVKPILPPDELLKIIDSAFSESFPWIADEGQRKAEFRRIISSGTRKELAEMITTIYRYREKIAASKKKLHSSDEHFLKDAEKILYDECAYVLKIKPEQVSDFLCSRYEHITSDISAQAQ